LYVGKAKNLINRMRSYARGARHSNRISQLVFTATKLEFKILESELQALLVEAELIRTYQPQYNILLKDDKTPLYIYITNDAFPRILQMRKNEVLRSSLKGGTLLGPFQSAYQVREVLKIARPIFPWCNKLASVVGGKGLPKDRGLSIAQQGSMSTDQKACFYFHLDLCPGACVGEITAEEYQKNISNLVLFLRGKATDVAKGLKKQMQEKVAAEEFEAAGKLRDALATIEAVTTKPYRLKPNLMLPALTANEAKDGLIFLKQVLATYLSLPKQHPLKRIEGYDVSNISGTNAAVAMVTFINGYADSSEYRLFNIRTLDTPNDYHMMKEALVRRQNNLEWGMPDLLVIDGGKGQLRAALSVWQQPVPIISIAKDPDRLIIPKLSWPVVSRNLPVSLKNLEYHVLELPPTHPGLVLIQKIRNEAHRFSKKQHARRRERAMFE
jgi:excinuclease ABC subunit C